MCLNIISTEDNFAYELLWPIVEQKLNTLLNIFQNIQFPE